MCGALFRLKLYTAFKFESAIVTYFAVRAYINQYG